MLPFIITIILWPLVTFSSIRLFSFFFLPIYTIISGKSNTKTSLLSADLFQAVGLIVSQIILIGIVKYIYNYYQTDVTVWLALPFGVWCLIFGPRLILYYYLKERYLYESTDIWEEISRTKKHLAWTSTAGLGIGWIISTILLID
jgi:hypothetical protein